MKTITLYLGAHGCELTKGLGMSLRSLNHHKYRNGLTVNFLSMAGLANVYTEMGILTKKHVLPKDKTELHTDAAAQTLRYHGTDNATLAYLVPNIFEEEITSQARALALMTRMEEEIKRLAILASLEFPPTSESLIINNPQFEKKWFFSPNPGEDRRRENPDVRSGPARFAGDKQYNPIMAIYGLFILQTTDEDVKPSFSISDIPDVEKIQSEETGIRLIRPHSITSRNLLEPISYTSYWKKWINAFDFSSIPDEDISEVGSVTEAIYVLKQMMYTFAAGNYNQDNPRDDIFYGVPPVDDMSGLPPVEPGIARVLNGIATSDIIPMLGSLERQKSSVDKLQTDISRLDERANALEQEIELSKGKIQTRATAAYNAKKQNEVEDIDRQLVELQQQFDNARADVTRIENELDARKQKIIDVFTDFIKKTLKPDSTTPGVNATIKNIIMRNKLKNILKLGIRDREMTLSQVLIFFRSLGYNNVNIVDPSCFTLKNIPKPPETQLDTQELYHQNEERGSDTERLSNAVSLLRDRTRTPSPAPAPGPAPASSSSRIQRDSRTQRESRNFAFGHPSGGTKRKKSKCSRKRRTRRKRCTTQRRRRQTRQNFKNTMAL